MISTLRTQYVAAFRPSDEYLEGPESFVAFRYVDDGAFIEPWVGVRPWQSVALWGDALATSLGRKAMHLKKREVGGNSDTVLPLRGIVVSTEDETFAIPPEKVNRAREFLASGDYDPGATGIPLKNYRSYAGNSSTGLSVINHSQRRPHMWIAFCEQGPVYWPRAGH